jgi:hypothetical protein
MAALIIKNHVPKISIGHEIPLNFGSVVSQSLYSRQDTTPSTRAVSILQIDEGDKCLIHCDNTWVTLHSKVLSMLSSSDLGTRALALAMTKRTHGEYLTRWVQSFMLGDQESIVKDAVTSCSTYDALVDVCEEIQVVLDSELPIEEKSERIFHELSTFISENDDPYNSTMPKYRVWMEETGRHIRAMIESDRKTLNESPGTKILHIMENQSFMHIPEDLRLQYFSNPIDLFDSNPHKFVAHLHQIELGDGLYTNVIVLGCSYFTPFALESNSRPTTRIVNSACLAAVTDVLARAGIVEQEASNRVTALFRSFGILLVGHGTVDRPEGSVPAACHQTIPEEFCTHPWKGGAKEFAYLLMRKHGDTHTLTQVGNRLHLQYAFAILQIMGIAYIRKWLHDIHGITLGEDPESFFERMQLQGVKNCRKRYQLKNHGSHLCGFEGWCVRDGLAACNGFCRMHFIDDSCGKPLATLQNERYIELCQSEVRLYNEQRDESLVFRNVAAVQEYCQTHKFGTQSNEKGISCNIKSTDRYRLISPEDIKTAGPNGLLVEKAKQLPPGYDGKWIWTLTGRLTYTTASFVYFFERDQNGNYQHVETSYNYQCGRIARYSSSK